MTVVAALLSPVPASAQAAGAGDSTPRDPEKLPESVRGLLVKVGRFIDRQAYAQACGALNAFIAAGGPPPPDPDVNPAQDPKADSDEHRHPMIYFALGNCHLLQKNYTQARQAYVEVLRRRPAMTSARLNLAKAFYEAGMHIDAAGCFEQAYDLAQEKNAEHLYYGAAAYLMGGDHDRAVKAFQRLLAAHPAQVKPAWKGHAVHALLAAGQARRSLPLIQELIACHTGDEQVRWQEILLQHYVQLEMTREASALAQTLTRQDPAAARWWKYLCQIRLAAGEHAPALAALTIYGYLQPLTPEEKKLWAGLNLHLGIPAQAAPVYGELLAGDNPDPSILKNLVLACRRMGRQDAALAQLEKYNPGRNDPEWVMLRADLLYELKRFEEAARAYRQAARPGDQRAGQAWLMAGYAAWRNNDLDASRQAFERAAGFDQQRRMAARAIRQLMKAN